jgi:hypothetical protein
MVQSLRFLDPTEPQLLDRMLQEKVIVRRDTGQLQTLPHPPDKIINATGFLASERSLVCRRRRAATAHRRPRQLT